MPRFAVKERLYLTVVTYVDADTRLEALDLVMDMGIFDYDQILDTDIEVLGVAEAEGDDQ